MLRRLITKLTGNQFKDFGLPQDGTSSGNPMRRAVLTSAKRIREGNGVKPRHLPNMGVVAIMPELDYYALLAGNPDLTSNDPETETRAWEKFLLSPAGEPYRLSRKRRGPQCRSIIQR